MVQVDDDWTADRLRRPDVRVHALCEDGGGKGSSKSGKDGKPPPTVAAAALESPFPAERLLRSLVNAGKDDEVLYIDAICADRLGAAYRLLTDMIEARREAAPRKRLVVVLMAVVSSDVLSRYARWGFQCVSRRPPLPHLLVAQRSSPLGRRSWDL